MHLLGARLHHSLNRLGARRTHRDPPKVSREGSSCRCTPLPREHSHLHRHRMHPGGRCERELPAEPPHAHRGVASVGEAVHLARTARDRSGIDRHVDRATALRADRDVHAEAVRRELAGPDLRVRSGKKVHGRLHAARARAEWSRGGGSVEGARASARASRSAGPERPGTELGAERAWRTSVRFGLTSSTCVSSPCGAPRSRSAAAVTAATRAACGGSASPASTAAGGRLLPAPPLRAAAFSARSARSAALLIHRVTPGGACSDGGAGHAHRLCAPGTSSTGWASRATRSMSQHHGPEAWRSAASSGCGCAAPCGTTARTHIQPSTAPRGSSTTDGMSVHASRSAARFGSLASAGSLAACTTIQAPFAGSGSPCPHDRFSTVLCPSMMPLAKGCLIVSAVCPSSAELEQQGGRALQQSSRSS